MKSIFIQASLFKLTNKLLKEKYNQHSYFKFNDSDLNVTIFHHESYIYKGLWAQGNSSTDVMDHYLKAVNYFLGDQTANYFNVQYISQNLSNFILGQEKEQKILEKGVCRSYSKNDKVIIKGCSFANNFSFLINFDVIFYLKLKRSFFYLKIEKMFINILIP